jgi:dihydrofolate reductase
MRKIVAGLAITLDGITDSPSGNWMRFSDEMWEIISAGIAQADAILLGTATYLEFAELWPRQSDGTPMADFMNNTPKYVASRTLDTVEWSNSRLLKGDLAEELDKLKRMPGKNIQVPGSPRLVRSLLVDGLLDELALMIHPIVLGGGNRLFDGGTGQMDLQLVDSRTLSNGVILATYTRA